MSEKEVKAARTGVRKFFLTQYGTKYTAKSYRLFEDRPLSYRKIIPADIFTV